MSLAQMIVLETKPTWDGACEILACWRNKYRPGLHRQSTQRGPLLSLNSSSVFTYRVPHSWCSVARLAGYDRPSSISIASLLPEPRRNGAKALYAEDRMGLLHCD